MTLQLRGDGDAAHAATRRAATRRVWLRRGRQRGAHSYEACCDVACGWEGSGDGAHAAGGVRRRGVCGFEGYGKPGEQLWKGKSTTQSVGKGKENCSPDVTNAKCQIRPGDRGPCAVQSVNEETFQISNVNRATVLSQVVLYLSPLRRLARSCYNASMISRLSFIFLVC